MKKKLFVFIDGMLMAAFLLSACGSIREEASNKVAEELRFSSVFSLLFGESSDDVTEEPEPEETSEEPEETSEEPEEIASLGTDAKGDEVVPGSSQTNAYLVPLNTKVFGTVCGGQYAWFAFTTGEEIGATYNVTFVNETVGSDSIIGKLYDEYGTELEAGAINYYANSDGVPTTITSTSLEPNTTYYVCLRSRQDNEDLEYSLIIKNPEDTLTAYRTLGTLSEAVGAVVEDGDTVTAGTNINDALVLPLGAKVHGTTSGGQCAWFSFTTGDNAGATYNVTFVDDTPSSDSIIGKLYDEYGTELEAGAIAYYANSDGVPTTITSTSLEPNTMYYVSIYPRLDDETIDYSIMVKSPDADTQESDLIFETPFEINDTQIQFVAESDEFIDEAQAKEVLEPVAEAILAHPDSSVLLAGTTATDGSQAARVVLSEKRAEAVKNLLVTVYKVPESQIETIGLGFEDDPFERGKDRDANGNFVESEGRKNRRVVVLDTEDPIAQEILKK